MALKHAKTNNVANWTQADLDAQIALGNFAPGTLLADITLAQDWNSAHTIDSGGLTFTPNASPTYNAWTIVADSANRSFTAYNADSNVALQIGKEGWATVYNNTGSTIANGTPVYVNGFNAGTLMPTVALASNTALTTSTLVMVTTETIPNASLGECTVWGDVRGINTSAFTAGVPIYVGATAGTFTTTKPTSGFVYLVGAVGTSNATTGYIRVMPSTAFSAAAAGNVTGAGTTTLTAIPKWGDTTGTTLNNSTLLLDSSDNLTKATAFSITTTASSNMTLTAAGGFSASCSGGNLVLTAPSFAAVQFFCGGGQVYAASATAQTFSIPTASNNAFDTRFVFRSSNDTNATLTASTEATMWQFSLNGSRRNHAGGNYALQRELIIQNNNHSYDSASVITDAALFAPAGAAIAGSGATFTNTSTIYSAGTSVVTGTGVVTNSYGLNITANTGATNNYAAQFLGGPVKLGSTTQPTLIDGDMVNSSGQKALAYNVGGNTLYNRALLFSATATQTVANTTTETTAIPTGLGAKTLAANTLTAGKTLTILGGGVFTATALSPVLTVRVKLGGVTIATGSANNLISTGGGAFQMNLMFTIRTTGASGTLTVNGNVNYETALLQRGFIPLNNGGATAAVDTTISNTLDITIQWGTAAAANSISTTTATFEISG